MLKLLFLHANFLCEVETGIIFFNINKSSIFVSFGISYLFKVINSEYNTVIYCLFREKVTSSKYFTANGIHTMNAPNIMLTDQ